MAVTRQEAFDHMKSRVASLREIYDRTQADDEDAEAAQEELDEFPLCVEMEKVLVVTLGTGGPHDEFRLAYSADDELRNIEYMFAWSGSETVEVYGDDAELIEELYGEWIHNI